MPDGKAFEPRGVARLSVIRREYDGAWADFVVQHKDSSSIDSLVRGSWLRCREIYRIDPDMRRAPSSLSYGELEQERERNDALRLGCRFVRKLDEELRGTGHALSLSSADGYLLETVGEPKILEKLEEINFRPGADWREETVGNNGQGTALNERRPVQVIASQHFVEAWQRWACTGAPILDPASGQLLAVLAATGYLEEVHPMTLVAVCSTASLIESEIRAQRAFERECVRESFANMALGNRSDGLLAIDFYGNLLHINAAAESLFGARGTARLSNSLSSLQQAVQPVLGIDAQVSAEELEVYCPDLDRFINTVIYPVRHNRRTVGVVAAVRRRGVRASASVSREYGRQDNRTHRIRSVGHTATYTFEDFLGGSAEIARLIETGRRLAQSDLPVLIVGETGTGKEIFAQAIHNASRRARGSFLAVNCGATPQELSEAEFLGYEAGAFTGAKTGGNAGKFELANGGTIFLDEVTELPPKAQASLLRILEEMEVVPLGGNLKRRVNVRVIAASNKNLRVEVEAGRFRRDLFYRLSVVMIELPPLRQRREDVPVLARAFLEKTEERRAVDFTSEALEAMSAYDWPGNVRELKNMVQRTAVLSRNCQVGVDDLQPEIDAVPAPGHSTEGGPSGAVVCNDAARDQLLRILANSAGNISEASRQLRLSRTELYRRLHRLSISKLEILRLVDLRKGRSL